MQRTLKEIISLADSINPNAYSDEVKASWVNEVEGFIQGEIFSLAPNEITPYLPYSECKDIPLSLEVSHDKIYITYLNAMINFADKDFSSFNNALTLYNAYIDDYAKWYVRHHGEGEPLISGMYLSAYGIAVKHGFTGSEEEWILSLKGDKGERGEPFTYEDFTEAQLEGLKGPKGDTGERGEKGDKGEKGEGLKGLENESNLVFANLGGMRNRALIKGYNVHSLGNADGSSVIFYTDTPISDISSLEGVRFNYFYKRTIEGEEGLYKTRGWIENPKERTDLGEDRYYYEFSLGLGQSANYFPRDLARGEENAIFENLIISPDENGEFPEGVAELIDNGEKFTSAIFGVNGVGYLNTFVSGIDCIAAAYCAVSVGRGNFVEQEYGFAAGYKNYVRGQVGIALGTSNQVLANYGNALGNNLTVGSDFQTVLGRQNVPDYLKKYCLIVGNGTNSNNKNNALTLDWEGNLEVQGEIKDGKGNVLSEKVGREETLKALGDAAYVVLDNDFIDIENSYAGSYYSSSYPITKLLDGVKYGGMPNCWHSSTDANTSEEKRTLYFNFLEKTEVVGLTFYPRTNYGTSSPGEVKIVGIYEDREEVIAERVTLDFERIEGTNNLEEKPSTYYFPLSADKSLIALKVIMLKAVSGGSNVFNFTELEFLGTAKDKFSKDIEDLRDEDLTDYIKNTDYARDDGTAGIVRIVPYTHGLIVRDDGTIGIAAATPQQIISRLEDYAPIVPAYLNLAVKEGVANNSIELTKEEKAAALDWLGVSSLIAELREAYTNLEERVTALDGGSNDPEVTLPEEPGETGEEIEL